MILPGLLDLAALAALIIALWCLRRPAQSGGARRRALAGMAFALVLVGASAALNLSGLFQQATGINLGMPATAETKARFWVEEHREMVPVRGEVGRNMRLIADGLAFYRTYGRYFPPDAHPKMDEYDRLPRKVDHVLSFAEEARYFYAAQDVCSMIQSLAGTEKPEKAAITPAK